MRNARAIARNMRDALRPPADHFPRQPYFVVSPHKTGSTTVAHALLTLGAGKSEMAFYPQLGRRYRPVLKEMNEAVPTDLSVDKFLAAHQDDIRRKLAGLTRKAVAYDIFADVPFGHGNIHPFILRALAPHGRFIWVNRDMETWLDSVRRWEESHPDAYPGHQGWQTRTKAKKQAMRAFWHLRRRRFRRLAKIYPDACLELDITELQTWDRLAEFTGKPAPNQPLIAQNVSKPG